LSAENWWEYIEGYKKAGDFLLSSSNVLSSGRKEYEIVYPMIFSYRHYIELQLKEIILNAREFLGINEKFPDDHSIEKIWGICGELLQKMDEILDPGFTASNGYGEILNAYNALKADLKIFWELDPNSESFRYPVDKHGNPTSIDFKDVDFNSLKETINRIYEQLSGISSGVYTILGEKYDGMEYERQDYEHY